MIKINLFGFFREEHIIVCNITKGLYQWKVKMIHRYANTNTEEPLRRRKNFRGKKEKRITKSRKGKNVLTPK